LRNRIKVSCSFFVPLLEVIYEDKIRKPLEFLSSSKSICKKLEQLYFLKKGGMRSIKSPNNAIFVNRVGSINICLNNESYNYYRLAREDVCNNEPIRPFVSFTSSYKKWRPEATSFNVFNGRKKAEIYLSLVGNIVKKFSYDLNNNKTDILGTVTEITRLFNKEKSYEKKDILKAVYSDFSDIHVKESDLLTILELNESTMKKIDYDNKKSKNLILDGMKIIFADFNKIILICSKEHSNLFIERVSKTISLVFFLKVLARRVMEILDMNVFDNKHIERKFEFYEYILSVLDLNIYSSIDNLKILPNHYQRILCRKTAEKLSYDKYIKTLENKTILKIKSWELREQIKFLSRNNKIVNRLRLKYKIERDQITEPVLTEKERIVLDFLLDKYWSDISHLGVVGKKLHTFTPIGSVSRNILKEEINLWMKSKNIDTSKIVQSEFKESNPRILVGLINKGLVEFKKPEKGRTQLLYYLKENDNYIQTRLRSL